MIVIAVCTALIGVLPVNQALLYVLVVMIGLFAPVTNVASYTRGIASWFRQSVGTAFGLALNGSSVIALFAIPATAAAIGTYGWRAEFLTLSWRGSEVCFSAFTKLKRR